tara:strand:+ start:100 stop:393 length:294 start_codon:yes stop_codon:yes gene_type:complete
MADFEPAGNDFYIVYTTSEKNAFASSFLVGTNPTGSAGVRVQENDIPSSRVTRFSTLETFNTELQSLGQTQLSYDPYTQPPPDTICTQNDDGECSSK